MSFFERAMLWGSSLLVGVSGVVYAAMKYLMSSDDPYAVINHPLQPLILKIHIVTAPLLVFAIGAVFVRHIWEQWRAGLRRGRISGLATLLTFAPMVLSGYLIQSVTHESWLTAMVVVHLVTGGAFLLGLVVHQIALAVRARRGRHGTRATISATGPIATPSPAPARIAVEPGDPGPSEG
jgi:hypothetical protein